MKYQALIKKIHQLNHNHTNANFSQAELELLTEALETIQFLEIIFKVRKEKQENHE